MNFLATWLAQSAVAWVLAMALLVPMVSLLLLPLLLGGPELYVGAFIRISMLLAGLMAGVALVMGYQSASLPAGGN